jgi:hypothetical protein
MNEAVCCPHCDEFSRVPASAIGYSVVCPNCEKSFTAIPESAPDLPRQSRRETRRESSREVPVVFASKRITEPEPFDEPESPHGQRSVLIGLALLPMLIPILWLLGPMLTGKQAIFTYVLPCAIAASAIGVSLGVVFAADWSYGLRIRGILAIFLLAGFSASFLYFLKTEWVEAVRRQGNVLNEDFWVTFQPPDQKYKVSVPARLTMLEDPDAILDGWELKGYRSDRRQGGEQYFVAHGLPPDKVNGASNEKFFREVLDRSQAAIRGELIADPKDVGRKSYAAREFVFLLPDRATKRIVQVFRVERFVFVAAIEGAFLPTDARFVKKFFNEINPTPTKK